MPGCLFWVKRRNIYKKRETQLHNFAYRRSLYRTFELYIKIWFLRKIADMEKANLVLHSFPESVRIPLVAAREVQNLPWGGRARMRDRMTAGHDLENFQKKCLTKITHFVILYRLSSKAKANEDTGRCQAAPQKAPLQSNIWQLNRNAALKILLEYK